MAVTLVGSSNAAYRYHVIWDPTLNSQHIVFGDPTVLEETGEDDISGF
jgi:hypothetical protein